MGHKLLLADDSVTIQRVIELTFSGEDIEVLTVGDGEQAIARIPADRPDIVLADIGMPKRNGYDVAAFVKTHDEFKTIPVLLLAGAFEPVDTARAAQVGCDGVLVKPFEPQQVVARVRELLEGPKLVPVPQPVPQLVPERPAASRTLEFPRRDDAHAPSTHAPASAPELIERSVRASMPREESPLPRIEAAEESLDSYFDRLDSAFAAMTVPYVGNPPDSPRDRIGLDEGIGVPTLDEILGPAYTPPAAPAADPLPASAPPPSAPPSAPESQELKASSAHVLADAFTMLLAVEQGEPGARPPRLVAPGEPVITDALVDELTRRVAERVAPNTDALVDELTRRVAERVGPKALRSMVADVVSQVAERLVREEIERIRAKNV